MFRQWRWVMLALIGMALGGSALYWYASPSQELRYKPNFDKLFVEGSEPITPIPLDLQLNVRKVALGRRLFFDARLSHDDTISCSSCHKLESGGADGLPHPIGIGGKEGKINTLTVFNSQFNYRLFWDGRAETLEDQIDFPLINLSEMGSSWDEVIIKLRKDADYRRDFADIYSDNIQPSTVMNAIVTFERSLTTPNGKFDRYLRGDKQALDKDELAGYQLFKNLGCISCHQGMNVGGNMYEKLGLFKNYFANRGNVQEVDYGRYNVTKNEEHRYEFRVPSLRNVALTAPYFHDASAKTLEQAVSVMGEYQLGMNLSEDEITKIAKFLHTLTGIYQPAKSK
jgi:cytochrome c peroxidase